MILCLELLPCAVAPPRIASIVKRRGHSGTVVDDPHLALLGNRRGD